MQHSNKRLIMDSPSTSKMIWFTTTSPTLFPAFENSFKLLTHHTGNEKEKFPRNPAYLSHLETSPKNKHDTSKSDSKSGKNSSSKQKNNSGSTQSNTPTPKEATSNLSTKFSKGGKLTPQEHQC